MGKRMKPNHNLETLRFARGWTQVDAATALGMSSDGYIKIEHGSRNLSLDLARSAADIYSVSVAEVIGDSLLDQSIIEAAKLNKPKRGKKPQIFVSYQSSDVSAIKSFAQGLQQSVDSADPQVASTGSGEQHPFKAISRVRLGGRIVAGGTIDVSTEQHEPGMEYEIELSTNSPDGVIAYQVVGDSMMPAYKPDMVIICRAHTTDIEKFLGEEVAVGTKEHGRMLKTIQLGTEPRRYNLESHNATTIRNVEVVWVAAIAAIIPAKEWRTIARRVQAESQKRERLRKPSQRQLQAQGGN